jgi:hypothetical protein
MLSSASLTYLLVIVPTSPLGTAGTASHATVSSGFGAYLATLPSSAQCNFVGSQAEGGAPSSLLTYTGSSNTTFEMLGQLVLSDSLPAGQLTFALPRAPSPGEVVTIVCTPATLGLPLLITPSQLQLSDTNPVNVSIALAPSTNNSAWPAADSYGVSCTGLSTFTSSSAGRLLATAVYSNIAPLSLGSVYVRSMWPFFQVCTGSC